MCAGSLSESQHNTAGGRSENLHVKAVCWHPAIVHERVRLCVYMSVCVHRVGLSWMSCGASWRTCGSCVTWSGA
jgi:hypothetical protein